MGILSNSDVKKLFWSLCLLCAGLTVSVQIALWANSGALNMAVLALSLVFSLCILLVCRAYFSRQQQVLDWAVMQLDAFAAGDQGARIDCDREGSLYRLFHAVNRLSGSLNTAAGREQQEKLFLKNTISDISHQLKTPLAALEIYNSLLLEESGDPSAVADFATKSGKELERIEALVQSLLKMTRLDAGSVTMDMKDESVVSMLAELKERFDNRAQREGKEIVLSCQGDRTLLCDRIWLMEALSNLVKNALDHTGEGGIIKLSLDGGGLLRLSVSDNGSGIASEDICHIFKRFYRSRFSQDIQGLGLGLPLAKAIVEANGGSIEVESVPGQGACFTLTWV